VQILEEDHHRTGGPPRRRVAHEGCVRPRGGRRRRGPGLAQQGRRRARARAGPGSKGQKGGADPASQA
jgi:hypothetical protein